LTVPVVDPFGVSGDSEMPFLAQAMDPADVERRVGRLVAGTLRGGSNEGESDVRLLAIRVVRHKPGRRCLIEYDFDVERPNRSSEPIVLIGKARTRRSPNESDRLLRLLRARGFANNGADGIGVPEPVGVVREYRMSLEKKVPGHRASKLFGKPGGIELAHAVAEAACKLHRAAVPPRRSHSMADEIAILRSKLGELAETRQQWAPRLARLLEECERLGARVPTPIPRGIHRDFYADQVIVDGPRLFLVDFDLFCQGDPALDAGNFLGHLSEQSLRLFGDPASLSECEGAFEEQFVSLSGPSIRPAVRAYATLTIARHVYLSTRFEERRTFTETLLELAEERLGAGARTGKRIGIS
jgi:Phosphotransferase enzyme family